MRKLLDFLDRVLTKPVHIFVSLRRVVFKSVWKRFNKFCTSFCTSLQRYNKIAIGCKHVNITCICIHG